MIAPAFLLLLSLAGLVCATGLPGASDWLLLAAPATLASLILLLRAMLAARRAGKAATRPRVIVDGSNVMHWRDNTPRIETLREVIMALDGAGFAAGVVFDANAGYKLAGRYLHDRNLSGMLGLPTDHVMIVPRGEPADPAILTAARDFGARVVSNDRFRDWADSFPDLTQARRLIRGGYRDGKLWLEM